MITSLDLLYATDDKLVNEGADMLVGVNAKGEDIVFKVAQFGNPKHQAAMRKREKIMEQLRNDDQGMYKLRCSVIAESILLDWIGVLDENGNEHPSTFENKLAVLIKYKSLCNDIALFGNDRTNFMKQADLDAELESEKN